MFITFEGGDGVGKSTNIKSCADWLRQKGVPVHITREPGGTALAEDIRSLIKQPREENIHNLTELLLVFAARNQHIKQVIEPALNHGEWVLCDRFTDSTIAYQGYGRDLSLADIDLLKTMVQQQREPDLTFLLDAPIDIGISRAQDRAVHQNLDNDRFEREDTAFFTRVREGFLHLAERFDRIEVIDASQPLPRVQEAILKHLARAWQTASSRHE